MMAKRSREFCMWREKNQVGCIWSLVSKLHPRSHRSIQKLLLDEGRDGHGLSRSDSDSKTMHDTNDSERSESIAMSGKPSVKTLMDEEMNIEANADADSSRRKYQSTRPDGRIEQSSADDIRGILEYLSSLFRQRNVIHDEDDEEKFSRCLGKLQLGNGKQLIEDEKLRCSKVLVSMLQILNSSEFSVLDREVTFNKCAEILHESQLGRSSLAGEEEDPYKMNVESSSVSSRIIILKPGMTELRKPGKALNVGVLREIKTIGSKGQKTISDVPSFLSDIKRKMKNVAAEEYSDVTADTKPADKPACVSYQTKKYLSDVITDEDMGMILPYPELNCSHLVSPGRRWEHGAVNASSGSSSRTKDQIICDKWRKTNAVVPKESDPGITSFCASRNTRNLKKNWHERGGQQCHQFPLPEMSVIIEEGNDDAQGVAGDLPERPSPVSVLEPPFSDDDISRAVVERVEFRRELLELEELDICIAKEDELVRTIEEDKESVLDQVRVVLQASDLKWEDLYLKFQNSDRLIEPSLFHDQLFFKDNAKLLVDCVNEALLEACTCFFGRSVLSLVKQRIKPIPSMDFTIHEACRVMKWHLNPIPLPRSLEQIIGKDMSRRGLWLDLTSEGESISFEVCESIFSELLKETVISSVDESSEVTCQLKIRRSS